MPRPLEAAAKRGLKLRASRVRFHWPDAWLAFKASAAAVRLPLSAIVSSLCRWRSFSRRTTLLAEVEFVGSGTSDGAIVDSQLYDFRSAGILPIASASGAEKDWLFFRNPLTDAGVGSTKQNCSVPFE